MKDIEFVREASPIEDVAGQYAKLRKEGKRLVGLCPLHLERDASFKVYPETQTFYCYGCGKGGDVRKFIEEWRKSATAGLSAGV